MKQQNLQFPEPKGNYESPSAEVIKVSLEMTVCSNTENYEGKDPWA